MTQQRRAVESRIASGLSPTKLQQTSAPSRLSEYYGTGADGNVTISVNTDLARANFKNYRNLTINASITLQGNSPFTIFVYDTLTLNGTVSVNTELTGGAGGGGGGAGGSSGGRLFVFARRIIGTGTIRANGGTGSNGAAATAYTAGSNASTSEMEGTTFTGATLGNLGGGATGGASGTAGSTTRRFLSLYVLRAYQEMLITGVLLRHSQAGPGAGGAGSSAGNGGGGGGGGGSAISTGGDGGTGGVDNGSAAASGTGGGGGSSAGVVAVGFESGSAVTVQAIGGDGGTGSAAGGLDAAGGGGGGAGAGGLALVFADQFIGTLNVNGGTGGTGGAGNGGGTAGSAGQNGHDGLGVVLPRTVKNASLVTI